MKKQLLFLSTAVAGLLSMTSPAQRAVNSNNAMQLSTESSAPLKRTCAAMNALEEEIQRNPEAAKQVENNWKTINDWISNNANKTQATITIPVVVHVIYNPNVAGSNVSDAVVQSQITALNKDYSATNTDYSLVPSAFNASKGNPDIQFCLAKKDPSGAATTGITRTSTTKTVYDGAIEDAKYNSQKGHDVWDRNKYLNIWVVPGLRYGNNSSILGYAQSPNQPGKTAATDGVVIWFQAFGTTGVHHSDGIADEFNKGRTSTHEIGHWLGLFHIWGNSSTNTCSDDDGVSDTPIQLGANYGKVVNGQVTNDCPSFPLKSCSASGTNGEMFMNYMDYVWDKCMYFFTKGQASVMQGVLANFRVSLQSSNGCSAGPAVTPVANFSADKTNTSTGVIINFTDLSTNSPTSWAWTFPGGTPATSTLQNPSVTYSAAGVYNVSLAATNTAGSNTATKNNYITIVKSTCDTLQNIGAADGVTVYFADSKAPVDSGYISGHNGYKDKAICDIFKSFPSGKKVYGALVGPAVVKGNGSVTLTVWGESAGKPAAILGSQVFPISTFQVNKINVLNFSTPVTVPAGSNYYVGFQLTYAPGDTFALYMKTINNANVNTAWTQEVGGAWGPFDQFWGGIKSSLYIRPVICEIGFSTQEIASFNGSASIYPNPTSGELFTDVTLLEPSDLFITVTNTVGQVVSHQRQNNTLGGNFKIDLTNQQNGIYFVTLQSDHGSITKKFILNQ